MRSSHRQNGNLLRVAEMAADLRTGDKVVQVLREADPHFLQFALGAFDGEHARPEPRIGGDKGALNIERRPGLHMLRIAELRWNGDRLARLAHVAEIIRGAFAGTGSVFSPLETGKSKVGIESTHRLQGKLRG